MTTRPRPIGFWNGRTRAGSQERPYIDPELQKGTTPLAKLGAEGATRNFLNFHHPEIQEEDFGGARAILDNRFKLVIHGEAGSKGTKELFDVRADPAEKQNLITSHAAEAEKLERQLRAWQQSVLQSLTGADYR